MSFQGNALLDNWEIVPGNLTAAPATQEEMQDAFAELSRLLDEIHAFEKKYNGILRQAAGRNRDLTEEERNLAAIQMLDRYSKL